MIRNDNPQNYRNFEESCRQTTDDQRQQQPSQSYRQPSRQQRVATNFQWQPVDQDYQRWQTVDEDGNQTEVEEVVMVGMKPVMMGFGMGDEAGAVNPISQVLSWMKNRRFIAGLVLGAIVGAVVAGASLSGMRNQNADLISENKELAIEVESLERELDSLRGQGSAQD